LESIAEEIGEDLSSATLSKSIDQSASAKSLLGNKGKKKRGKNGS
jgi:hypothetical protein